MKVQSIKRNADFIRFSVDVTVEVNPGLVITCSMMGEISKGEGPFKHLEFVSVDDHEWGKIEFFGEEVKYKGLQELHDKLFKKSFSDMETEVDKYCEAQLLKSIPNSSTNISTLNIKRLLKQYLSIKPLEAHLCAHANGDDQQYGGSSGLYVLGDWQLGCAMRLLGFKQERYEKKNWVKGKDYQYIWGYPQAQVRNLISNI